MDLNTSSNKKNGLIYRDDFKTIIGIDTESNLFTGRVPFGAHKITAEVFSNTNYDSISLPDSIKELGDCLFENAQSLTKVKLPYDLKVLPAYLFAGCTSLEKVQMPNEVTAYPEGIFYNCAALQEPILRPGVKQIPVNAFAGCTSFKSVIIPDYVADIQSQAFANCTGITSVILPSSIMDIAPDAFEGCTSITSVRMNGDSAIFFIGDDGCLYEHTANGDELIIKINAVEKQSVQFFQENEDELTYDGFLENDTVENELEIKESLIDESFSSEISGEGEPVIEIPANAEEISMITDSDVDTIDNSLENTMEVGVSEQEMKSFDSSEPLLESSNNSDTIENTSEIQISQEEENSIMDFEEKQDVNSIDSSIDSSIDDNVNSMLADIMNDEKERMEVSSASSVAVDEKESQILTEMMDVMNDKADQVDNGAKVSEDELARLFSSNESSEPTGDNPDVNETKNDNGIDPKLQILIDSVAFSSVVECTPNGEPPADATLFVVAEKTIVGANGSPAFSGKLVSRAKTIAHIQDFKQIVFLNGLPIENDEFIQFYHHFMGQKNIIFACEAANPANLSEYAKRICDESRISLNRDELIAQRKKISIKNSTLIKTVMQDKYDE